MWNYGVINQMLKIAFHCFQSIAGRDKPPPLLPNLYLKVAAGFIPAPGLGPVNRNRSDSVILLPSGASGSGKKEGEKLGS